MKKIKKPIIKGQDWSELIPYILNKNYDDEKDKELLNELDERIMSLSISCCLKNSKKDLFLHSFYLGGWPYLALLDPMVWNHFSNALSVAIGYMGLIEGNRR